MPDLKPSLLSLLKSPARLTLAAAESLTSGGVQAAIGAHSGISAVFQGGITAYNLEKKVQFLKVDAKHAESVECVSPQVAQEMAIGVCDLFDSDIGVSTTGFAEPYTERGFAAPTAYWAICHRTASGTKIVDSGSVVRPGVSRTEMQAAVVAEVMSRLTAYLVSLGRQ